MFLIRLAHSIGSAPTIDSEPIFHGRILQIGGYFNMERIESFSVNHLILEPGIYVSRKDEFNNVVLTTFDIRMTTPNKEPVMNTAEIHTIEHLGATYLRNNPNWKKKVVYFGPMGCRTGFYLILEGDLISADVVELVRDVFSFIVDFEGDIPGAKPEECGNYLDQNLDMAKWLSKRYINNTLNLIDDKHLNYQK